MRTGCLNLVIASMDLKDERRNIMLKPTYTTVMNYKWCVDCRVTTARCRSLDVDCIIIQKQLTSRLALAQRDVLL